MPVHSIPRISLRSLRWKFIALFFATALLDGSRAAEAPTGLASIHVPEGFTVCVAAPSGVVDYPMCATMDERGRIFVTESTGKDKRGKEMAAHRECIVRLVEDKDDDGVFETSKVFAEELSLPMGVLWHQGSLFVAAPPDFVRLDDKDGDGVSEAREVLLSGWNVLNTASLHGPFLGPDGMLYLTHGRHGYKIATKEGETLEGLAPRLWRCRTDGTALERICGGGFDNPVELIFTPVGEMIGTMTYFTDPRNGQRDALMHWVEGGVYSKPHECVSEFKRTGDFMPVMTKFARIAPAGLLSYRNGSFGSDFDGNLFSAQFNPHRVQRHKLIRDGATFRTEDEDFLTSTDPDFHPTDVMEDADGSLLVVDTGGWYVDACPLSRVSKPDIRGAIYRVRRKDAAPVEDPRGKKLTLDSRTPEELAALLSDRRFAVRDHAAELVIAKGEASTPALARTLKKEKNTEVRLSALWALHRVGGAEATKTLNAALTDSDPLIRAAAARSAGIRKDDAAVRRLTRIVRKDDPVPRREAATALGMIRDPRAVPSLLDAAAKTGGDRFIEHSIINALIQLDEPRPVIAGLRSRQPGTRKAALVALDQMNGRFLEQRHIGSFLKDKNDDLRRTGLWAAAHHPEWSGDVIEFLSAELRAREMTEQQEAGVRAALAAFAENEGVQARVAELLASPELSPDRKLLLIDTIDRLKVQELPDVWIAALGKQLEPGDERVRGRALALVRARSVPGMEARLDKIGGDPAEPASLRVAALGATISRNPAISAGGFEFLKAQVAGGGDPALRLASAQLLAQAKLTEDQLMELASGPLASADALVLPSLAASFRDSREEAVGNAMVKGLLASQANSSVLRGEQLEKLLSNFPPSVRASAEPLLSRAREEQATRTAKLAALEPLLSGGDVGRGRRVFFSEKLACSTCHSIGKEGGTLGPDLTAIGAIRSGRDLLEAVVFPSSTFVPGYEPVHVETAKESLTGIIGEQTADAVVLRTGANAETRLPRSAIKSIEPSTVSVMPEGLDTGITQAEFLDLLAFLQAQNGEQWLSPERRQVAKK